MRTSSRRCFFCILAKVFGKRLSPLFSAPFHIEEEIFFNIFSLKVGWEGWIGGGLYLYLYLTQMFRMKYCMALTFLFKCLLPAINSKIVHKWHRRQLQNTFFINFILPKNCFWKKTKKIPRTYIPNFFQ